jgi:hypothetical protein
MIDMNKYQKTALFVVIAVVVVFSKGIAHGENWILFNKSRDGTLWYYDSDSIVSPGGGNIKRVWDKSIRTDEWRRRFQETSDKFNKNIDAMSINHTLTLDEFNCSLKAHRFLQIIDRSKEGREIYSQDIQDSKWGMIPPGSVVESLFKVICKE